MGFVKNLFKGALDLVGGIGAKAPAAAAPTPKAEQEQDQVMSGVARQMYATSRRGDLSTANTGRNKLFGQ